MKLFTINEDGKLIPYQEHNFENIKQEADLEVLLESNPEYFFEKSKILIIGRQVNTNLNTFIDLLGIDKNGNTVIIELKRGSTPRETVAQLLEYASYIENLDYSQLNDIYQDYAGEESNLEDYYQQYFQNETNTSISFNKTIRLVIVAQHITKNIRQISSFLTKKGIDIYCLEFKYFETKSGERIISSDLIIGEEEFMRPKAKSSPLPRVDEKQFLNSLDKDGLLFFQQIFEFAKQEKLSFRWGSKGFSLNIELNSGFVALFFGYPPNSVFKQSIYTGFEEIRKKVNDSEEIITFYRERLEDLGYLITAKSNLKWIIDKAYPENEISRFLDIVMNVIIKIKRKGLK